LRILRIFQKLESSSIKGVFNALPISKAGHRIAKNQDGFPVIMICTKKSFKNKQRFSLQNLSIQQDIECRINDGTQIKTEFFTLIIFTNNSTELQNYFFRIAEPLLDSIPKKPTEKEVTDILFNFLEIFRALLEPAQKSVLGLWGELFVIAQSINAEELLDAWHDNNYEKYDFGMSDWRIEVKTTIKNVRIHSFSLEQLNPISEVKVEIASILTKRIESGKSIEDLCEIIRMRVANSNLTNKMNLIIAQILGETIEEAQKIKFDIDLAFQTLRFYSTNDIPKIFPNQIPSQVCNVKFDVDLSTI
jgi:hypothetical protein